MYDGITAKDYNDLRDVIATYLLRELPTIFFTNAVLDSDPELVEEIAEFGSYDTMSRDHIFESCTQFLLNRSSPSHKDPDAEMVDKSLKEAYASWMSHLS